MSPSLIHEPIAKLALYQLGFTRGRDVGLRLGFTRGRDVGLRLALDALTAERGRQETMAAYRVKRERSRYVYAEGVLLAVTQVVASRLQSICT